jgi:hypothetical protein
MGNLFNALNDLKTNIFGGGNTGQTTPILRKTAIGINEESPISKLDHDPFAYSSIQYPRDLTSNGGIGHYMLFYVNVQDKTKYVYEGADGVEVGGVGEVVDPGSPEVKAVPAEYFGSGANRVLVREAIPAKAAVPPSSSFVEGASDKRANYFNSAKGRGGIGSTLTQDVKLLTKERKKSQQGMSSYHKTTKRITDSVAIYLPPNVVDSTTVTYQSAATGIVGAAAAGAFGTLEALGKKDYEAAASGLVDAAQAIVGEAALKASTELVDAISGSDGTRGLINKAFGQADNPYLEVLFQTANLRTFSYNFTFSPKNKEETEDVQKIIQLFRFHMSPELKGKANRFLTLPSEFDIHYMYQAQDGQASENDYYNKIATCVCTACEVNYTPDGVKSFEGGAPTKITMNVSFQETEMITKKKVNEGF